jgi:tRNA threonylcarbamoyladenosine biosynthesis protein TsaB
VLILAVDTTTRAGSLAVLRDGAILTEMTGDAAASHAERLPLDFAKACASGGVSLEEIDVFAVAAGPGSFTGLRVGIASVQGLAFAAGKKVIPVSALEAIAVSAARKGRPLGAWMDAQRQQVFAQLFLPNNDGDAVAQPFRDTVAQPFRAAGEAVAATPADVLALWGPASTLMTVSFRGDGAVRYADTIRSVLGSSADIAGEVPPLAGAVARIAAANPHRAVLPHAVIPIYVRRPDVELARERRSGQP